MYSEINIIWGNKIKDDYKQDDWDFTETHLNLGCRLRKKLELVLCQQLFLLDQTMVPFHLETWWLLRAVFYFLIP
jgi:hypothetical protein